MLRIQKRATTRSHRKTFYKTVRGSCAKRYIPWMNQPKPTSKKLEDEIEYCQKLVTFVETESGIAQVPKILEPLNLLKETISDDVEQLRLAADPDARVGHKSADSAFFGYKTHLAMTEERIITAAVITTGEKNDGKQLQELIK